MTDTAAPRPDKGPLTARCLLGLLAFALVLLAGR